jgi:hypothetical protein
VLKNFEVVAMLTETTDYAALTRNFRWDIPARFNIAAVAATAMPMALTSLR